ncbi:cytochrome c oxidase assembly protein COX20, mitochondrial [Dermacentor silvarum]|uniref:cytochrome c oxidase assembly protein COX20, mitochondrial n=1 Tax=Dermacentor silvarum TaxID=543639 RepID=UPI001899F9B8|nr:cytochrome c oxidase assembly protein COX20, mitochondrial [Dermacentor silvarum]
MARNAGDIDDPPRKPVMFMGRNIEEIPCFRQVFITGILSGLGIGFGTFMLTSRPRRSADAAVYSFVGITMFYWFYCRYQFSVQNFEYRRLQREIQAAIVERGSDQKPDKPKPKLEDA